MIPLPRRETSRNFRADINGLRAWAVVAVVLYHFGIYGASGGYVGVDVFFVISGYLMTGIIVRGLERGEFSLWSFYLSRGRRIIPALVVAGLAVLALGWFLLMPKEYQVLGRHVRESLFFTSNIQYLSESGYFDSDAHEKWLLHTWSLSVEWQFYLLLPLILMAVWRLFASRTAIIWAHGVLLVGSFVLCLQWTSQSPDKAFYLLYSRAWEMLLGGLLFLLPLDMAKVRATLRWAMSCLGLLLITASIVLLDSSSPWPGWRASLPALGAALVIVASSERMPLTSGSVMQWLGTRSYSIYLWHWPIVAVLAYFELLESSFWITLGLLGSLFLGSFSYICVEVPTQRLLSRVTAARGAVYLLLVLLGASVTAQIVRRSGLPVRLPDAVADIESYRQDRNPRLDECLGTEKGCIYGDANIVGIVLGDSHADAVITAAQAALPVVGQGLYFRGASSCLLVFGARRVEEEKGSHCSLFKEQMMEGLAGLYPGLPVIVINATSAYVLGDAYKATSPTIYFSEPTRAPTDRFLQEFGEHYLDTACRITESHPLFLMRPIPEMPVNVPNALGKALLLGKPGHADIRIRKSDYLARHAFIWELQDEAALRCGAKVLDPLPYLCDDEFCYGSRDGLPLYSDTNHLSEHGNKRLVPMFREAYRSLGIE
ncbi:acyltransferase [Pseudomonas sp. GD03909]|nr:acyltransferase [Pseudomonas sp. GD03909]